MLRINPNTGHKPSRFRPFLRRKMCFKRFATCLAACVYLGVDFQRDQLSMYSKPGVVPYNGFCYYFLNGALLYKKNIHTEYESIILALASGPINSDGAVVISVVYDTIYYVTYGDYGEYENSGNTYLCRVSINGGASEHLASWFTA